MYLNRANENQEYYFKEGCHILEMLNNPVDPEVSVARARVESGVTTKMHRLHGITERYVILSGKGEAEIGGEKVRLSEGDVVVIPKGVAQNIRNTETGDLTFLAICSPRFEVDCYEEL